MRIFKKEMRLKLQRKLDLAVFGPT